MSSLINDEISLNINTDDIDINIDTINVGDIGTSVIDCPTISTGSLSQATIVSSLNSNWGYSGPFGNIDDNSFIIGDDTDSSTDLYVIEKWQSHHPIDMGDGLYTSFKEDLLSKEEINELIYNKLENQYPDKAIKVGLNKDITIRKYSMPIEIKTKDD